MQLPEQKPFIGGRYVDASSGETFDTINPATGEVICKVQKAGATDVDNAVTAARAGFATWSRKTGTQRSRILMQAVQLLRERNRQLAELEVMDNGKPIQEAEVVDVSSGADCIEYFAGLAPTIGGQHVQLDNAFGYTRREPLGVCAGIGAWNYPLQIACWKSGMALACGNSMIYKPASLTPLSALKLAEIYAEAGLPDGAFNVICGDAEAGQCLSRHPGVDKVSLTGSTGTGKRVMADAATTLKKVTMELGGKSPLIVFADADLENAVSAAMMANFYTQGEICTNGTRVFVEQSIHDRFVDDLLARTSKLRIGDPMDPATQIGALISTDHMATVLSYIEKGVGEGAKLRCGGKRPDDPALAAGCFVEPTVFTGVTDGMSIATDEIFGPVMSVLSFSDEDEVIRRANDTDYGLAAGVFTRDLSRGHRVIAELEAGTCWINNYNVTPIELPLGGFKQSGIGLENSPAAIEHYTQLKSVYVELGDVDCPYD